MRRVRTSQEAAEEMRSSNQFDLSQFESLIVPVLIIDSVFRGFALLGLLWNLSTYLPSIGIMMLLVKAAMYLTGIAANVAILQHKPWGTRLGFGVAGVGIWLVLTDGWSLLHVLLGGPISSAVPKTLLVRALLKTFARAVWLAVYLGAVWLAFQSGPIKSVKDHTDAAKPPTAARRRSGRASSERKPRR